MLQEGLDVLSTLDTKDDFSAIVVTKDTAFLVDKNEDDNTFIIIEFNDDTHYALGSGNQVANYMLSRGGDPVDAVAAAMTTDLGSGGDIIRWSREEAEDEPEDVA